MYNRTRIYLSCDFYGFGDGHVAFADAAFSGEACDDG